jgi:hypothetical protein
LKKLIIELKDTSAVILTGGNLDSETIIYEFGQLDFADDRNRLFNLAGDRFQKLCAEIESVILIVPMQYSMVKLLEIDNAGLNSFGEKFIEWEASLQLPDELGKFKYGFNRLGPSFDQQRIKYLFWAAPENVIGRLVDFLGLPAHIQVTLESESMGLYSVLNFSADKQGFNAAVAAGVDGVSIVISHDGDFVGARFIGNGELSLKDEVMYYIIGAGSESLRPQILYCGDSANKPMLGELEWADKIIFSSPSLTDNNSIFYGPFGLTLID